MRSKKSQKQPKEKEREDEREGGSGGRGKMVFQTRGSKISRCLRWFNG